MTHGLAPTMRQEVDKLGERRVYEEIDLPLVPVLLGMEKAGVRIDLGVLGSMADRLAADMQRVGEQDFCARRSALQHQFAEATGRRAVQQDGAAAGR